MPEPGFPIDYSDPCETAEDLIALLDPSHRRWNAAPNNWVFRGQSAEKLLLPNALRENVRRSLQRSIPRVAGLESDLLFQQYAEARLLVQFLKEVGELGLSIPYEGNQRLERLLRVGWEQVGAAEEPAGGRWGELLEEGWPPEELLRALALGQHYGLPTRLLDWTHNPHVAACMAARSAARKHFRAQRTPDPPEAQAEESISRMVVWALDRSAIHMLYNNLMLSPSVEIVEFLASGNQRQAVQAGVFTLVRGVADDAPDQHALETVLEHVVSGDAGIRVTLTGRPALIRFSLPWSQAPRLARLLDDRFVSAKYVYRDLEGAALSVKDRLYWDCGWDRYSPRPDGHFPRE